MDNTVKRRVSEHSSPYYSARETRGTEEREFELFSQLRHNLRELMSTTPRLAEQLDGIEIGTLQAREDLVAIPVVRKSTLMQQQHALRGAAEVGEGVFGGFAPVSWGQVARVYGSPGPIYELDTNRPDYWRMAQALYAAGVRPGMLVHNCFSYHFTPAGNMLESGALALGCSVFPGGIGQTELQVKTMLDLRPDAYTGTPSFLKIIMEKAEEMGEKLDSLKHALFTGEAFTPTMQQWFAERGVDGYQCYGTADLGLIAYETSARDGLVIAEDIILEIVRPGTNDPVADGEVGEVVVTTLNPDYPLLRFGTGDMSMILSEPSSCGRTNRRIKGWMGRADQSIKVRGMFVHPEHVAELSKRLDGVSKARMVANGKVGSDNLVLQLERAEAADEAWIAKAEAEAREVVKLRTAIEVVGTGSLPNDGLVIQDSRDYE
ncbi:MAG: AMP-binding protein [Alcaligenaceae bacterium]|nr:AMP-binding protein [Alcaligenaceae bacterium]